MVLLGAALLSAGVWCQNVATVVLLYRLTQDTTIVALASVAQFSGSLVLAPFVGKVADTYDRRVVLTICSTSSALVVAGVGAIVLTGNETVWVVLATALVAGVSGAFVIPIQLAIMPQLVGAQERGLALSLNSMQFNMARAIGPLVATGLITTAGPGLVFAVAAAMQVLFVTSLWLARPRPQVRPREVPTMLGTFDVVRGNPLVVALILLGFVMYGATDVLVTFSPALSARSTGSAEWAGVFMSAFGIGAALVALFLIPTLQRVRFLIVPALVIQAVAIGFLVSPVPIEAAVAAAFAYGAAFMAASNRALTTVQGSVEPEEVGRLSALWVMAVVGGRVIFAAAESWLAEWLGVSGAGWVIGALVLAAALWFGIVRRGYTPPSPSSPSPSTPNM